jgi:hypothetical protein
VKFISTLNGGGPPGPAVTVPNQAPVGLVQSGLCLVWANAVIVVIAVMINAIKVFFVNISFLLFTFESAQLANRLGVVPPFGDV